jgi:endo-1,4-beta-mannosidase
MNGAPGVGDPFVLGVNYWPRRKAMAWWHDFDRAEVAEEFTLIADLGLRAVRIFLLWDDFQPEPGTVSVEAVRHLVEVADVAADLGLALDVTFFTGHMSGTNWAPRWLLDRAAPPPGGLTVVSRGRAVSGGYRNPYTDPAALGAERLLVEAVVRALRGHPATWLWNLGNEPDIFARPPDAATGAGWARRLYATIRALDDKHPVTTGLHLADLVADVGLRIDQVLGAADVATMHPYSIYADWATEPLDPDFAAFCTAVTGDLSRRPVLVEEFGLCTAAPGERTHEVEITVAGRPRRQLMASEEEAAAFVAGTLPRLVEVGAIGALIWCFADYDRSLWRRPPLGDARHERFFGLVRPDGSLKPHALVLRDFARSAPTVRPVPAEARFDLDPDAFYRDPMAMLRPSYAAFQHSRT